MAILAGCGPAQAGPVAAASARHPVVVELFQSQGCSSCPPANANINAIADRPDVLALSFGVTYWDQLGWKDTFASPRWTARQWDYARQAGRPQVATPQVIVNGGTAIVGSNRQQLDATIAKAGPPRGGPELAVAGTMLRVGAVKAGAPSAVWLVRYDPRVRQVPIRAGENGGRTLPHRDIVRQLVKLGTWSGSAATFAIPASGERRGRARIRGAGPARRRRPDHRRSPALIPSRPTTSRPLPLTTPTRRTFPCVSQPCSPCPPCRSPSPLPRSRRMR